MELEFSRELIILAAVVVVFVIGVPLLVRGHKSVSLEESIEAAAVAGVSTDGAERRQSRRQKARIRDASRGKAGV